MRIVQTAENYPARCFVTANVDGPYVDFESYDQEFGNLYLHTSVVEEAADLLDLVPKEKFEQLREQIAAWCAECDRLRERVQALETLRRLEDEVREEVAVNGA